MVSNPFQEGASVKVSSDTSGFDLSGAESSLLSFKTAAAGVAGVLAGGTAIALGKSASKAADFEAAMADVEKVTNEQTADELSGSIEEMAEEIPLAAEEIANLSAQAGRFGAEGTEEIENFTRTAAEMGAATTLSADEAGRSLAKVATALDEPLGNVQQLGDSINELSNNFATNSQEIVDAAQRGGFAVSNMGLQSDEVLGLSAAMNEVFPSARRAGNGMKQLGEAITDPDNVSAFAETLGVTEEQFRTMRDENPQETLLELANAMQESDDASQILSDSLSTQQVRAFERMGQQSDEVAEAMGLSNQAMQEGGSLARELAIETDTFHGQLKLLKSQINNVMRDIGEALLPILTDLLGVVSDGVEFISNFGSETEGMNDSISETMNFIAPLVDDFEDMIDAYIETSKAIAKSLEPSIESIADFFNNNQDTFTGFAQQIQDSFEGLTDFYQNIMLPIIRTVFKRVLAPIINNLVRSLSQNLGPVISELTQTIDVIGNRAKITADLFLAWWEVIDGLVMPVIDGLIDIVNELVDMAISNLAEGFQLIMNLIQGDFGAALGNLENIFDNLLDTAADIGGIFLDAIVGGISSIVTYLQEDAADDIRGGINSFIDFIMDKLRDLNLTAVLGNVLADAKQYLEEDAIDDIIAGVEAIADQIKSNIQTSIDLVGAFVDVIGNVADYLIGTGEGSALGDITDAIMTFGGNVGGQIIDAIQQGLSDNQIEFKIPEQTIDFGRLGEIDIGGQEVSLDLDLPGAETGGLIKEGGLARLHAGERVVPAAQVTDRGEVEASGGGEITLILEENTDVIDSRIEQSAENVIVKQKRRTQRKTGRSNANISG